MQRRVDPRLFQIGSLGTLLAINIALFDIGAVAVQSLVTIVACLLAQWLACEAAGMEFDPLSPAITGLSLSLLLRTHEPALWVAAAGLAIETASSASPSACCATCTSSL